MLNPTIFTLGQAAQEVGVSKSAMSQAVKKGRVSAKKTPAGSYEIQAAELFRVWPKKPRNKEPETAGVALVQQAVLEAKLEASEQKNKLLESQLEDTRIERDKWADGFANEQAKSAQYRLDYQQEKEANLVAKPVAQRSALTPWILALILVVMAGLLADRFGLIPLLDVTRQE
jgi:hypothetical protein